MGERRVCGRRAGPPATARVHSDRSPTGPPFDIQVASVSAQAQEEERFGESSGWRFADTAVAPWLRSSIGSLNQSCTPAKPFVQTEWPRFLRTEPSCETRAHRTGRTQLAAVEPQIALRRPWLIDIYGSRIHSALSRSPLEKAGWRFPPPELLAPASVNQRALSGPALATPAEVSSCA